MCTLILGFRVNDDAPLLVGANRDESLQRPSEGPAIRERGSRRVLAPLDRRAKGTWLGLNDAGVFAGITNRFGPPTDFERRSRGELVFEALEEDSARRAAARLDGLAAGDYNAFHLVVADAESAHVVVSDGGRLSTTPLPPGFAVVTERSYGAADNPRKRRVIRELYELRETGEVGLEAFERILSEKKAGSIDAVCVDLGEIDYGTRSSTLLRLGNEVAFRHAEGPPCEVAYQEMSELAAEILG